MKNEHTFHLPTLNETGDPSGIFFSDRYAQLVSGGCGYDKNCAVVIESDDYEILMNLERTFAEQRAFCEVSEAAFYFDLTGHEYKFKHHQLHVLDGVPYDVIYSEITLEYDKDEKPSCCEKYYRECWFDISRAFHGDVAKLEDTIVRLFDEFDEDTLRLRHLLELRKRMINSEALKHQEKLLPDIIAFNDALTQALHEMLDKAHYAWEKLSLLNTTAQRHVTKLSIKLFFGDYPKLHPVQDNKRETLWAALHDSELNPLLYDSGISLSTLIFPEDLAMSFDSLIGMDCPPPNWNEGLDQELTKDLHLTSAFHNVFDHMNFAITDFIYVRNFVEEMEVEFS